MHEMNFRTAEIFEHDRLGSWNITSIRKMIDGNPEAYKPINVSMTDLNTQSVIQSARQCNQNSDERINSLSVAKLSEPIILLKRSEGMLLLIDGTHRLLRLERDHAEFVRAIVINEEDVSRFKIA